MRPILKSPRILRTGAPLSLEGIRQVCPSVFATQAHESRGPRYRYVPTSEPVQHLMDNGWGIYEASQSRSKSADRDGANKHMLRMRKLSDFHVSPATHGDGVPEVILINSHDGTSAYHLKAGFFRFVCSNGLMVGTQVAGFTVRHTVGPQTSQEVLEAGERVVTESFPIMLGNIDRFKTINMNQEYQYRLAEKALELRYGGALAPITAQELLQVRRDEDKEPSVWNVLNRVQENTLYGGWETRSAMFGRRSQVRPVERVSAVTAINVGIWDEASAIAQEICNAE
jgi:hypothetical protein